MAYKIAIGGIHIESSTFTPYRSGEKDFKVLRGQSLLDSYTWLKDFEAVECIPLINARAIPGGPVTQTFYMAWLNEMTDLLKTAVEKDKIDGLLLDIHGAMSVEGMMDAEGTMAEHIRAVVGDDVIISTTMDLHGNVSDQLFQASDLMTCYRTAPHIDQNETRKRAFDNLLMVLNHKSYKVVRAKVEVPILLPGEKTSTEVEPGKGLYASLEGICAKEGIIDAAIWMGFPWADQNRCHSNVVVTGWDETLVKAEAEALALKYFMLRDEFKFVGPVSKTEEAVNQALASKDKPFFISDTGDNPGAGGSGDMNVLLKHFIERNALKQLQKKILMASIFDEEAINTLYEHHLGDEVFLALGGKISFELSSPVDVTVKIQGFFSDPIAGKAALVNLDNIFIIITEKRFQYGKKAAFIKAGLKDFDDYDIIVVKMGYLEPELSQGAKGWVMALTPGAVNQDMTSIDYKHLKRPLYPLDEFKSIPDLEANIMVGRNK